MKQLSPKAQQAAQMLASELELSKQLGEREQEIEDILEYSDGIMKGVHTFFNNCMDYLNAPASPRTIAPIAAWNGIIPSQPEVKRALDLLKQMMTEAMSLMQEVTDFRDVHAGYCEDVTAYLTTVNDLFQNMVVDGSEEKIVTGINSQMGKMQGFAERFEKILASARAFRMRLQVVEQQMSLLKGVN